MRAMVKYFERKASLGLVHALHRYRMAPHVLSVDIRRKLPRETFATVLDVGANVGQSTAKFLIDFPDAKVYSFEPDPGTFQQLDYRFNDEPRVKTANVAIGSSVGSGRFDHLHKKSLAHGLTVSPEDRSTFLPVPITTVDKFCAEKSIAAVDLLKIDTEGYDLEVLKGASGMLATAAINLFTAECTPNRDNTYHAQFTDIHAFAEGHGYRLFGLYDLHSEWRINKPHLRRFDAAYISPAVIDRGDIFPAFHPLKGD